MTGLAELPTLGPGVVRRVRVNRNELTARRAGVVHAWLRDRPELGLIASMSVSTYNGIDVQISWHDQRPVDALLAWFYLLDKAVISVDKSYVDGARLIVGGRADGCPVRVWACLWTRAAIQRLGLDTTVHTLRCLQIEGAR